MEPVKTTNALAALLDDMDMMVHSARQGFRMKDKAKLYKAMEQLEKSAQCFPTTVNFDTGEVE